MSLEKSIRPEDEISLDDFLRGIKYWLLKVTKNWVLFLVLISTCIAGLLLWRTTQKPTYNAQLTLMLSDDGASSLSGLSGVLGQFGLPVSSGKYNIDKLIEISRSRRIVESVLNKEIVVANQSDKIANHIINFYELAEVWESDAHTQKDIIITDDSSMDAYNYIIKNLYHLVVGHNGSDGLLSTDYGRDHYIMTFEFNSISEELSIAFLKEHFNALRSFYIEKSIEKQKKTFDIVKSKKDSISRALRQTEREIAIEKDKNSQAFRSSSSTKLSDLSTQSLILKTAYAKAEENLAIADLALQDRSPLIQIIDAPMSPIRPNEPSLFRLVFLGLILGLFGGFLLLGINHVRRL